MRAFVALCLSCLAAVPGAARRPVREGTFVRIGGIDQWLAIKGDDRKNPVVLFLHGGPGDASSPFADALYKGWEKDFTLVQWDQRGAGRTYSKSGPGVEPTMTIDRMVKDGIEVSQFLNTHLHKKKIIIVGGSWGSVLGIYMAHTRPDLFYAYIGIAQIVNWRENVSASYARVLEMARASGDRQASDVLTQLGAPPWHSVAKWPVFRKWEKIYQARLVTAPPAPDALSPEYASAEERAQYDAADDFSFLHFWGSTLSGPLTEVDLSSLGTNFAVPVFIVQGAEDLTALPELAKAYFDTLRAPRKRFYLVPGAGHSDSTTELEVVRRVLDEQVRPLLTRAAG